MALAGFVAIEARSAQPLLPLWIFADRNRAGVYLILLCLASVFFGMFFFLTLFTQVVWGYSALRGGLAYLPFIGGFIAIAGICTRLVAPFGARVPMTIGAALAPASMFWLSRVPPTATGACAVPARPYASVWSWKPGKGPKVPVWPVVLNQLSPPATIWPSGVTAVATFIGSPTMPVAAGSPEGGVLVRLRVLADDH